MWNVRISAVQRRSGSVRLQYHDLRNVLTISPADHRLAARGFEMAVETACGSFSANDVLAQCRILDSYDAVESIESGI